MTTSAASIRAGSAVLGGIYDAALAPARWPTALAQIKLMFGAFFAQIAVRSTQQHHLQYLHWHGIEDEQVRAVLPRYQALMNEDPTETDNLLAEHHPAMRNGLCPRERLTAIASGAAFHSLEFLTAEQYRDNALYREIRRPLGMEHVLIKRLIENDGMQAAIGFARGPGEAPFSRADCDRLDRLGTHLRRAVLVHERLLSLDMERRAGMQALDSLSTALLLVAGDGKLIHASAAARELIASGTVLTVHDGQVGARDDDVHGLLRDAIAAASAASLAHEAFTGRYLLMPRGCGLQPLGVLVSTPPPQPDAAQLHGRALAHVLIHDPALDGAAEEMHWQHVFAISAAEARVLRCVARGDDDGSTAAALGLSVNTVRTHIKALLRATGTGSRLDLLRAAFLALAS